MSCYSSYCYILDGCMLGFQINPHTDVLGTKKALEQLKACVLLVFYSNLHLCMTVIC